MVDYDPFSNEIIQGDPHRVYKQLRDEAPVHYLPRWNTWVLSRFRDIWDACTDTESYSAAQGTTMSHLLTKVQPVTPTLNNMDPPDHTRLRAEMRKFFSPRRVAELEPVFRSFAIEAIEGFEQRGECEAVSELAQVVATSVGCEVAGFPREDAAYLRSLVDGFFERDPDKEGMTQGGLAKLDEMFGYFAKLSANRRGKSYIHDPIGILQQMEFGGRKLDDAEIASHLFLLLVGGTDTFPKVFSNLLLRLYRNPEARRRVAADASLALDAFNETVRIDMPTQVMARLVTRDHEIQGHPIREGQPILLLYASGNRDEREFPEPERFDLERRPPRTLSFSHGTHACIGLHVARAEGRILINELLARWPDYEVDESGLERYATEFVQGYSRMPVRWRST
jgi:cytochrome P450